MLRALRGRGLNAPPLFVRRASLAPAVSAFDKAVEKKEAKNQKIRDMLSSKTVYELRDDMVKVCVLFPAFFLSCCLCEGVRGRVLAQPEEVHVLDSACNNGKLQFCS